jgi:hypothetical protein
MRGRRGVFDFDEFVACSDNGDTRLRGDAEIEAAGGGGDGDFAAGESRADADEFGVGTCVGTAAMDVLARGERSGGGVGEGDESRS